MKHKVYKPKQLIISEDILNKNCVEWFYIQYGHTNAILHHSPNENSKGKRGTLIAYNAKMKRLGRLAGFPDLIIIYQGRILFIEFKSIKGIIRDSQKELFPKFLQNGFIVHIVRTLDAFEKLIDEFMDL